MREIKFRSWDGERMHKAFGLSHNPVFWWEEHYDYPLMQYTGLKDKNGVEIYEGDILRFHIPTSFDYQITWSDQEARWYTGPLNPAYSEKEVIGNIYENPDLLEATT